MERILAQILKKRTHFDNKKPVFAKHSEFGL